MIDDPLPDEAPVETGHLRFLRLLVTGLTATMIVGLLAIVVLFVMRFSAHAPTIPDNIILPDGAAAVAFTQATDWYAIVTDDNRILIYDRFTGELRQEVAVQAAP